MASADNIFEKTRKSKFFARAFLALALFVFSTAFTSAALPCPSCHSAACPCPPDKHLTGWNYTYDLDGNKISRSPICAPAPNCPATNNSDNSTTCTIGIHGASWAGGYPLWFDVVGGSLDVGLFGDEGVGSSLFPPIDCPGIYYEVTSTVPIGTHDHEEDITVDKMSSVAVFDPIAGWACQETLLGSCIAHSPPVKIDIASPRCIKNYSTNKQKWKY